MFGLKNVPPPQKQGSRERESRETTTKKQQEEKSPVEFTSPAKSCQALSSHSLALFLEAFFPAAGIKRKTSQNPPAL